jgi:hypothetical protein
LKALVGKKVRIERSGVCHVGVLAGEAYCRVASRSDRYLRWVLITGDGEIHFSADARWIVEPIEQPRRGRVRSGSALGLSSTGHPGTGQPAPCRHS